MTPLMTYAAEFDQKPTKKPEKKIIMWNWCKADSISASKGLCRTEELEKQLDKISTLPQ